MTNLLTQAFEEAEHLPAYLQDEIARQILNDIDGERRWQETLSNPHADFSSFEKMAAQALQDYDDGLTEEKGFGEE
jgi:hypothetical protein